MAHELAEHERPVARLPQLGNPTSELLELGRRDRRAGVDQLRVARELTEAGQPPEDLEPLAVALDRRGPARPPRAAPRRRARARRATAAPGPNLGPARQLGADLGLGATEHERTHHPGEEASRAPGLPARIGPANRSTNRSALPSRPGATTRNRLQSSSERFSTGVPVSATRNPARRPRAPFERAVPAFLTAWASSRTTVPQEISDNAASRASESQLASTTACGPSPSSCAAPGRNRGRSPAAELRSEPRELGLPVRDHRQRADDERRPLPVQQQARVACTVLPRPMSSARTAPGAQVASRASHRKPSTW